MGCDTGLQHWHKVPFEPTKPPIARFTTRVEPAGPNPGRPNGSDGLMNSRPVFFHPFAVLCGKSSRHEEAPSVVETNQAWANTQSRRTNDEKKEKKNTRGGKKTALPRPLTDRTSEPI